MRDKIVLATNNNGKLRELQLLLQPLQLQLVSQASFNVPAAAETGGTFVENAIIKARHAAELTGLAAIADDSGLVVDALGGAPGVYSARYASDRVGATVTDQDNIDKLLQTLASTPADERGASFHCVLVFMRHSSDPTPLIGHGQWRGSILNSAQGTGGFGYDPVFWVPANGCSAAQLTAADKSTHSHRGQALRALLRQLQAQQ